jgi:glycogen debranching enzyme
MGPFITAFVRTADNPDRARTKVVQWFKHFEEHLQMAGLGNVSEVFDAEAPHAPGGCIAQAWSAAELLRAAVEDVFIPQANGETELSTASEKAPIQGRQPQRRRCAASPK